MIRYSLLLFALALAFTSCKKDDTNPSLRGSIDYSTLKANTPYTTAFRDRSGASTVDFRESSVRLDMFSQLDSYMKRVTLASPTELSEAEMASMFNNASASFSADSLNQSGLSLAEKTAQSLTNPATYRTAFVTGPIRTLAEASRAVGQAAAPGQPGRAGKYLLDAKGLEQGQFIQKALMGAYQVDQISNVLLTDAALTAAGNSAVVSGKPYTELEHLWDRAYGVLTNKSVFGGEDALGDVKERFLGSYMLEMNGAKVPAVHIAFLKGRAAIANNDATTMKEQAKIIRTELEKTLALAAIAYLDVKVRQATATDAKMHALGEGIGFVEALRFCRTEYKADDAWTDQVLNNLLSGPNGAWDVDNARLNAAVAAIKAKFNL